MGRINTDFAFANRGTQLTRQAYHKGTRTRRMAMKSWCLRVLVVKMSSMAQALFDHPCSSVESVSSVSYKILPV